MLIAVSNVVYHKSTSWRTILSQSVNVLQTVDMFSFHKKLQLKHRMHALHILILFHSLFLRGGPPFSFSIPCPWVGSVLIPGIGVSCTPGSGGWGCVGIKKENGNVGLDDGGMDDRKRPRDGVGFFFQEIRRRQLCRLFHPGAPLPIGVRGGKKEQKRRDVRGRKEGGTKGVNATTKILHTRRIGREGSIVETAAKRSSIL